MSSLPTIVLPNANVTIGPVVKGQVIAISGVPGAWVALQSQSPFSAAIPFGQGPHGESYGSEGSSDQYHFLQPQPLTIVSADLPPAVLGQPYQIPLSASGGLPPYQWSLISGSPPPSIGFGSDGFFFGSSIFSSGTFTFSVSATDTVGSIARATLSITAVAS